MQSQQNWIRRLAGAFMYSVAGFRAAWINEQAFRQEIIMAAFLVPAALWLGTDAVQRALLIGTYLIVPLTELINSAIEAIVDRMGPEHHVLSGRAKDMGSAAVLLSLFLCGIVWAIIACERFSN
ncbi:MAG: diacylglycerol kinase [Desulfobacterales bacterium]|nr:diacylglycerol kinase [Desulfobacterales bacterium]